MLNLLSSQAAISIENAQLYSDVQASERKYRTIFEDSNDVIFISTLAGRFVDVNSTIFQVFGYTREEGLALNIINLDANPEERLRFRQAIAQHGFVKDFEVHYQRKDGALINGLITATLRHAEDGTLLGYQGIIRDITEQKQNELLRAKNLRLETELDGVQRLQQMLLPTQAESADVSFLIPVLL